MRSSCGEAAWRPMCVRVFAGVTFIAMLLTMGARARAQASEQKFAEQKPMPGIYQTFHLSNATRQMEFNDLQTDLRNMMPRAKIYGEFSQNAISIQGSAEDLALAQKMIAELDRPRKMYRLTYTITAMEDGKSVGTQHIAMVVAAGSKTTVKQGSRMPIVTGTSESGKPVQNIEVQYQDLGLSIEATLDGESLHTKVEQSSLSEERSGVGVQDPIVRQTVLDGMSNVSVEKPVVLGSVDLPGSTRREEIEVAAEVVK